MPPAHVAPVKICHNGEIHRFTWDIEANGFAALYTRFVETFSVLRDSNFAIQYTDPQGDVVTVADDSEYYNAWDAFKTNDQYKLVRFTAVVRAKTAAFHEHVADPILKAIEKLVETLNAAMEKVKHEDWKVRAQSGVEYTNEALKTAAKDARESLHSARQSIQEIPFEQLLKETTDGIKVAAEGISVFAKEIVDEMKKEKLVQDAAERLKTAAETVTEFAKDAVDELKHLHIPHGAVPFMPVPVYAAPADATVEQQEEAVAAEVVEEAHPAPASSSSSADSDWEQVAEQPTPAPAIEEEIVEVVVSEEEKKWAAQLATIRDIFPGVDTATVVERLEAANGDVEVVLNALMEAM